MKCVLVFHMVAVFGRRLGDWEVKKVRVDLSNSFFFFL